MKVDVLTGPAKFGVVLIREDDDGLAWEQMVRRIEELQTRALGLEADQMMFRERATEMLPRVVCWRED